MTDLPNPRRIRNAAAAQAIPRCSISHLRRADVPCCWKRNFSAAHELRLTGWKVRGSKDETREAPRLNAFEGRMKELPQAQLVGQRKWFRWNVSRLWGERRVA